MSTPSDSFGVRLRDHVRRAMRELEGPHASARVLHTGHEGGGSGTDRIPRVAVLLLHGRGATAESILALGDAWDVEGVHYLAPQATDRTWYPDRFLAPLHHNEPFLSSALDLVSVLSRALEAAGVPRKRQAVVGFSQGGCLALEWGARNAARMAGLAGLAAGLIGPPGIEWNHGGSLDGTPVFLGCGDPDPHIPAERVRESARTLEALGGRVTTRLYPGLGHTINADEMAHVRRILEPTPTVPR